jgi:hypothetical protein
VEHVGVIGHLRHVFVFLSLSENLSPINTKYFSPEMKRGDAKKRQNGKRNGVNVILNKYFWQQKKMLSQMRLTKRRD